MDWLNTGMPRMTDVTMWSQQFDALARFVKRKLINLHPSNSRESQIIYNFKNSCNVNIDASV